MAYDNIKLEKGLYSSSKGFTSELEAIDPSENYVGTELEGLDAFERQLKRFDIKISGKNSDPISKFFKTSDSAALFPEYISRAVKVGLEENDFLSSLIATTTEIDSLDYRSIESVSNDPNKMLADVEEGTFIPETTIKLKENLTKLHKRGRMLVASYEAIKYQKLDVFSITLKQIGRGIAASQVNDAIEAMLTSPKTISCAQSYVDYGDFVNLWLAMAPYKMTTIIGNTASIRKLLNVSEFKEHNAGKNFRNTGNLITPFGAEIFRVDTYPEFSNTTYVALDKEYAVEKVQSGGVMTDYDKLIDRQLERATISTIAGFSSIFGDAVTVLHS